MGAYTTIHIMLGILEPEEWKRTRRTKTVDVPVKERSCHRCGRRLTDATRPVEKVLSPFEVYAQDWMTDAGEWIHCLDVNLDQVFLGVCLLTVSEDSGAWEIPVATWKQAHEANLFMAALGWPEKPRLHVVVQRL